MRNTFLFATILCLSVSANAAPVIYSYNGIFSGSLGRKEFSTQSVSIFGVGDTDNVNSEFNGGLFRNRLSEIYFNIPAIGSGSFTGNNSIFYTDLGPGLSVNGSELGNGNDFFDSSKTPALNYDLRTSLGPVPVSLLGGGSATTTLGNLSLMSTGSSVIFTASVPEPSSIAILIVGIVGVFSPHFRRLLSK